MHTQSMQEVVDDSEPERVELRFRNRSRLKSPKQKNTGERMKLQDKSVIEISDSEYSSSSVEKVCKKTIRSGSHFFAEPIIQQADLTDEVGLSKTKILDLNRFAFPNAARAKNLDAVAAASSSKTNSILRPIVKKADMVVNISNLDLRKISRCVCCDISWTVRKTSAQKLMHIQSCSRKHAFDEDTVSLLIQKEVLNIPPSEKKEKNKLNELIPEPSDLKATTYLEDIVETAPKKKARRQQVESVLANVSQTREAILSKAQTIFTDITPNESGQIEVSLRRGNIAKNEKMPLLTQCFSESALGRLEGRPGRAILSEYYDIPPTTQGFAESSLGQLQRSKSRTLFSETSDGEDVFMEPFSVHRLGVSTLPSRLHQSPSKSFGPEATGGPHLTGSLVLKPDGDSLNIQLSHLHLDPFEKLIVTNDLQSTTVKPVINTGNPLKAKASAADVMNVVHNGSPVLLPNGTPPHCQLDKKLPAENQITADTLPQVTVKSPVMRGRIPKSKVSSTPSSSDTENSVSKHVTPKRRILTTKKKALLVFDKQWECHMKQRILGDQNLHMRILRYEPIHFDVFLEHATLYAPCSPKLKLHLRYFLDNQAIHFYGAEGVAWKR